MTNDPFILSLETSSTVCSVAITSGAKVLAFKEADEGYTHAENLHPFIDDVTKQASLSTKRLHAIALSVGPGSYTGLRIGSSSAKGLCLALNIPLLALGTLDVLAFAMSKSGLPGNYCPMLDAGRMEVYTAVFDQNLKFLLPVEALVMDAEAALSLQRHGELLVAGPGMPKVRDLLSQHIQARFMDGIKPSALHMAEPALEAFQKTRFTQIADFEPFYLKNVVAGKKKRPLS